MTVIIPAFNAERTLEATIESVLSQDYQDFELLIVDDGSVDDTANIVRRFDRAVLLERSNGGPSLARNTALSKASGELVAFLDHDDLWLPGKLSRQVQYLETHPEIDGVYTHLRHFVAGGTSVPAWFRPWLLETDCPGYTLSTLMVRSEVFSRVGLFQPGHRAEDADWFLRARDSGIKFGELRETLVMKRVHEANVSRDQTPLLDDMLRALHDSLSRRRKLVSGQGGEQERSGQ